MTQIKCYRDRGEKWHILHMHLIFKWEILNRNIQPYQQINTWMFTNALCVFFHQKKVGIFSIIEALCGVKPVLICCSHLILGWIGKIGSTGQKKETYRKIHIFKKKCNLLFVHIVFKTKHSITFWIFFKSNSLWNVVSFEVYYIPM